MKLRIVKKEAERLEMEVGEEGHTLLNLLQSSLLRQQGVKMAGYAKPHPLMERSMLYIDTRKGKQPEEALREAADDAKKLLNEFLEKLDQQLKAQKK